MVSYLTSEDSTPEGFTIPEGLSEVLRDIARTNPEEFIPLACTLPNPKLSQCHRIANLTNRDSHECGNAHRYEHNSR